MNLWIDTGGIAGALPLFGVSPLERLRRSVAPADAGAGTILSGAGAAAATWPGARRDSDAAPLGERLRRALHGSSAPLVAVDGANVIDPRLLRFLGGGDRPIVASRGEGERRAVALRLAPALADAIPADAADLIAVADALRAAGRVAPLEDREFPGYIDKLRRVLPFWLYTVTDSQSRDELERRLFLENYKGSTDLLTRWLYPPLVWPLVRACARLRIHPNAITVLSIILAFAAVPLFAGGHFIGGFLCAYAMSVLDSVDGKLARLTLTDSAIGNVLDHGLDQVHPPFWYFAWAWGLGAHDPQHPLFVAAVWLVGLYFADRLVLAVAKRRLGFALHAATRLDELARSIIARRNITMTIMAIALLLGAGPAGFYAVTAWQAATLVWHAARTAWLGFLAPGRARPTAR